MDASHLRSLSATQPPPPSVIDEAARALREGKLVAFPTETVYGLGALGLDEAAVLRIFEAKGRPRAHPLILHVADVTMAKSLVRSWPEAADIVTTALWPGGITIVLPRSSVVPDAVTGGGDTVAIRCPAHPVALALIRAVGEPIAAPSANRHRHVSPTTAAHVMRSLGDVASLALILDGGPCREGLESTVLDLSMPEPEIARPGAVPVEVLRRLLGTVTYEPRYALSGVRPSPGQDPVHYAPNARVRVAPLAEIERVLARQPSEHVVAITRQTLRPPGGRGVSAMALGFEAGAFAQGLYAAFYEAEGLGATEIWVEAPPDTSDWDAVRDRLARASADRDP